MSVSGIGATTAVLHGSVDPHGEKTRYFFIYRMSPEPVGVSPWFYQSASGTVTGEGEVAVQEAVMHLVPNTSYYFWLFAVNASGSVSGGGGGATFETLADGAFSVDVAARMEAEDQGRPKNEDPVWEPATLAGSHPDEVSFTVGVGPGSPPAVFPGADIRGLRFEVPPGLLFNQRVIPYCSPALFETARTSPYEPSKSGEDCAPRSQFGTLQVEAKGQVRTFGLFNLAPLPGYVGRVGAMPFGVPVVFDVKLERNPDGTYMAVLEGEPIGPGLDPDGLHLTIWGVPFDGYHDQERGDCLNEVSPGHAWGACHALDSEVEFEFEGEKVRLVEARLAAFSLPSRCGAELDFTATSTSSNTMQTSAIASSRDASGNVAPVSCKYLQFDPKIDGHLTNTRTTSPSGFVFRLDFDQSRLFDPEHTNSAAPRSVSVQLPEGTTINPAVAEGLGYCTPAQYAAESLAVDEGHGCPQAAQLGTFHLNSPFFPENLSGSVYLAQPDDPRTPQPGLENPFDGLVAVYMVAKLPERGIVVKVPGQIDLNPRDGTVTGHFFDLPEVPYEKLEITFRAGERSFLVTPPLCGYLGTYIEATAWGSAETDGEVSYTHVTKGTYGPTCPSGPPGFSPGLHASEKNPQTNAFTPYAVHLTRKDDEQEFTGYSIVLPKGVTGRLAGVAVCPDAAIEAARHRIGSAEAVEPSCPASSRVGQVSTGYGVGTELTETTGAVYLAGPHDGAPLSLVTIVPATLGPFDLGTVVIRSAFEVDPRTARLTMDVAASDPIPHILRGIVLHLRDVLVDLNRPEFAHNPSNCFPSEVLSTVRGSGLRYDDPSDDSAVTLSERFQLLNCGATRFQPKMGIRLRGSTRRGGYPQLRVAYVAREGDANLRQIGVSIPGQEFLAQEHIRSICTRPAFDAGTCPAGSVYGSAVAYTPMLDQPLRGEIYLRSSGSTLPDLVADLRSGSIRIILEGKIGPGKKGGVRAFFKDLPDEPLSRFVMTLYGGKRGLLLNSADICKKPPVSTGKAIGQNSKAAFFVVKLRGRCGGGKHHRKPGGKRNG